MGEKEIEIFRETQSCLERGYYIPGTERKELTLPQKTRENALVFLPDDIPALRSGLKCDTPVGKASVRMFRGDTLSAAGMLLDEHSGSVAVLNFANSIHPGGGVYHGSRAQEEDICRKSSLISSLESKEASAFYSYNRSLMTRLASDAVLVSPKVEVFRGKDCAFLSETFVCTVLTCAAPDLRMGCPVAPEEYRQLFLRRIEAVLTVAASLGYQRLVLGAWGCGAFGNDAKIVSDLFYRAVIDSRYNGFGACDLFEDILFAVPCSPKNPYNFYEFARNFSAFRLPEKREEPVSAPAEEPQSSVPAEPAVTGKERETLLNRISGSFLGGAIGDALGYPVEFLTQSMIRSRFGKNGITAFRTDESSGLASVSDDTQMTLFTAQGLLKGAETPIKGVCEEYLCWLYTQDSSVPHIVPDSALFSEKGLFALRAPGNTCLSALKTINAGGVLPERPLHAEINNSKGCGGIMRCAPAGWYEKDPKEAAKLAAEVTAITHGHPLGYLASAVAAHIVAQCVRGGEALPELKTLVLRARDEVAELFADEPAVKDLSELIDKAIELSENDRDDSKNIRLLGGGWVAEETLAIALYCALRHSGSFTDAVVASVNHSGDSDSTGAVTGNILGAYLGRTAIEEKWLDKLEFRDLILRLSEEFVPDKVSIPAAAENTQKAETAPDTGRSVLIVAETLRELRRTGEIAAELRNYGFRTPLCLISDDEGSRALAGKYGFEKPAFAFMFTETELSDRASEAVATADKAITELKPAAVLCFSGGPSGFGAAMAASSRHTDCIILAAGIRYGTGDMIDFLRSAADAAALWREAGDDAAFETLREDGCEKGSLIPAGTSAHDIAEKIKKITEL